MTAVYVTQVTLASVKLPNFLGRRCGQGARLPQLDLPAPLFRNRMTREEVRQVLGSAPIAHATVDEHDRLARSSAVEQVHIHTIDVRQLHCRDGHCHNMNSSPYRVEGSLTGSPVRYELSFPRILLEAHSAGGMFWFTRKRLSGSYVRLIFRSRSKLSP